MLIALASAGCKGGAEWGAMQHQQVRTPDGSPWAGAAPEAVLRLLSGMNRTANLFVYGQATCIRPSGTELILRSDGHENQRIEKGVGCCSP
jgi:hypothetical protein